MRHCMGAQKCGHNFERRFFVESTHDSQNLEFVLERQAVPGFGFNSCSSATEKPIRMFPCLHDKVGLTRCSRFLHGGPNSAPGFRDLLVSLTTSTALEIVQSISAENQVRMPIDKSRQHNFSAGIDDFSVTGFAFDFCTRPDQLDFAVADENSAIANDSKFRKFRTHARSLWTGHCDQLRSVKNGQWLHDLLNCFSTICVICLNWASESALRSRTLPAISSLNFLSFNWARLILTFNAAPSMHARVASAPTPTSETDAGFPFSAISPSSS